MKTLLFILIIACAPAIGYTAQDVSQQATEEKITALRAELSRLVASFLAPPQEITDKYSDFLKLPETGIVKLMPRGLHNNLMDARMEGGAYYSFVRRSHEYGQGNDIQLDARGLLRVGFAGLDYGFFANLGKGTIESIQPSPDAPAWITGSARKAWDEEWNYRPPTDLDALRRDAAPSDSHQTLPREGAVYLLRSIAPRQSDILVAFKVERKLNDGSVVIVWRMLSSWDPPRR